MKDKYKNIAKKKQKTKQAYKKILYKNVSCKTHRLHHYDLKLKEKHDLMYYTKEGEFLHNKICDGQCKQVLKDILNCRLPKILICQQSFLSATMEDDGCTETSVYAICYNCKQEQFKDTENRKRRRCCQSK